MSDDDFFSPFSMGRFGGAMTIGLGVALVVAGLVVWDFVEYGHIPAMSYGLWFFGVSLVGTGIMGIRWAKPKVEPLMSRAAARVLLETKAPPFWVCLHCYSFMERNLVGECLRCNNTVDCLEVADESDRTIAISAMGPVDG